MKRLSKSDGKRNLPAFHSSILVNHSMLAQSSNTDDQSMAVIIAELELVETVFMLWLEKIVHFYLHHQGTRCSELNVSLVLSAAYDRRNMYLGKIRTLVGAHLGGASIFWQKSDDDTEIADAFSIWIDEEWIAVFSKTRWQELIRIVDKKAHDAVKTLSSLRAFVLSPMFSFDKAANFVSNTQFVSLGRRTDALMYLFFIGGRSKKAATLICRKLIVPSCRVLPNVFWFSSLSSSPETQIIRFRSLVFSAHLVLALDKFFLSWIQDSDSARTYADELYEKIRSLFSSIYFCRNLTDPDIKKKSAFLDTLSVWVHVRIVSFDHVFDDTDIKDSQEIYKRINIWKAMSDESKSNFKSKLQHRIDWSRKHTAPRIFEKMSTILDVLTSYGYPSTSLKSCNTATVSQDPAIILQFLTRGLCDLFVCKGSVIQKTLVGSSLSVASTALTNGAPGIKCF